MAGDSSRAIGIRYHENTLAVMTTTMLAIRLVGGTVALLAARIAVIMVGATGGGQLIVMGKAVIPMRMMTTAANQ